MMLFAGDLELPRRWGTQPFRQGPVVSRPARSHVAATRAVYEGANDGTVYTDKRARISARDA